jgi:hypothetical protein
MVAGFWLSNVHCRRADLDALLTSALPPLIAFFFYTTGLAMRIHALRRTWPIALVSRARLQPAPLPSCQIGTRSLGPSLDPARAHAPAC